ncbi:uncharacterized protein FIBRA_08651 [Fibroporia radiculosa]|uniref:Cytoplasmic tRNA 2-thiolation protein 2 n=1 Tax=Fibroporia radiculosa TaxID=599839 RepID=J4I345_9APHY|nr:uncharacterized protein FIBRA_08651 [Fibroporia radiculosa]CCM06392.1 predicted protein [Fibroporia radiculosa]
MPADGGKNHPRHERVWKKVTVCYVEVCDVFPEMRDHTKDVARIVRSYDGFDFVPLRIQDAFSSDWWDPIAGAQSLEQLGVDLTDEELRITVNTPLRPASSVEALRTHLGSLPTTTAAASSVQTFIRLLLLHTAVKTGSSHLVLGTSLTSLAVSLISGVSQGRGFNIREETQEEWEPDQTPREARESKDSTLPRSQKEKHSVRVVRPLRDIGMKECAIWAWWMNIKVVGQEKWLWSGSKQDIGALTRGEFNLHYFIFGLEKDYPSTVSTVVRTCTKVAPKGDAAGRCALCARPVQEGIQEWKSRISIRTSSHLVSKDAHQLHTPPSLVPFLCYACNATMTSRSTRPMPTLGPSAVKASIIPLPKWAETRLSEQEIFRTELMSEEQKKNSLEEFLLEDPE